MNRGRNGQKPHDSAKICRFDVADLLLLLLLLMCVVHHTLKDDVREATVFLFLNV